MYETLTSWPVLILCGALAVGAAWATGAIRAQFGGYPGVRIVVQGDDKPVAVFDVKFGENGQDH